MRESFFQIFRGRDQRFYFRLRATNGELIRASEGYTPKAGCENGIESVRNNASEDDRYQRKTAKDGQYYFVLLARNGEPVGTSEMYSSEHARDNGIEVVKRTAPASSKDGKQWILCVVSS